MSNALKVSARIETPSGRMYIAWRVGDIGNAVVREPRKWWQWRGNEVFDARRDQAINAMRIQSAEQSWTWTPAQVEA